MDELKKKTETMLRAVLISSPLGVPLHRVEKEYRSITFEPIPYSKLGFKNLEDFLRSIPNVASIQKDRHGEAVVKGVASEADQHVAKLIAKQKKPKIRKSVARPRKPTFAFSATPNKYVGKKFGPRSHNFESKYSSPSVKTNPGDSRGGQPQTPRFVPPRLRKTFEVGVSQPTVRRASSDDQKPNVTPFQISKRTIKSKGPNFQGIEVTVENRITSPKAKTPPTEITSPTIKTPPSAPIVTVSAEVLERIGQLVGGKPNGLFLSRLSKEYKDKFGVELPDDLTDSLLLHPEVVHVEKVHNLYIAYPPKKMEEVNKATSADTTRHIKQEKSQKVELYIVKPFTVPNVGSSVQVYMSHVENASHFFVQYQDCEDEIQEFQDKLNKDFKDTTDFIKEPSPGMYCCAKFSLDDSWYRGKILKCTAEKDLISVEIFYVDFGNSEMLPNSRLRHLKKDHAELPQMAVHCSLDGIDNNDSSMTETLKGLTDKELKMTLVQRTGDVLYVRLADEEGIDVVSKFKSKGLSKQIGSEEKPPLAENKAENVTRNEGFQTPSPLAVEQKKPVKPFLRSRSITNEQEKKIPERVVIPNEDFIDILVINIFSTDNIIVMLYGEEYSDKLLALEVSLMSYFSEAYEETSFTPKAGEIWAIKTNELHSEDQWYRVKILSTKDGQAQLEFVDYGDTRQAAVADLKSLPGRFLELPFQAVSLALNNIPKTKKKDVIDTLKKFALEKPLVGEIIERTQDKISVELFDTSTETDININEIMRSLIIADEDLTPALPKPGHQVTVSVSHISDAGAIYVQIPGAGLSRLEELMTDITEHYDSKGTKAAEFVSQPAEGHICCAKCSDGSWYRAVILDHLPDRKVKVQCVDYGHTEVVSRTALREPTKANEHVNRLPFQAVECCLGTDVEWDVNKTEAVNQILSDQVILEVTKQGAIPIVKLLLTREDGQQVNILDYILGDSLTNGDDGSIDGSSPGKQEQTDKESSSQEDDQDDMTPDLPPPITLSRPWEDLTVSDIIDPGQFMFQPLSMLKSLEDMTSEMTKYYNNKTETLLSPRMGDLCAVRDKDGKYYRTVVKAVLSPKQVCVLFIDYGNLDIHTSSDFRVLSDQFKQLPCIAVKGSLSGIQPSENSVEWSEEAKKRFEELTQWKMLVGSVDGDQYTYNYREEHKIHLTLFDTSSDKDVNIADVLVNEGLARRTDS